MQINFSNSYAALPPQFYTRQSPATAPAPELTRLNHDLAKRLGLDVSDLTAEFLSGNQLANDSDPLAMVYAGHQFGGFNPQLGDGRALLLGEVIAPDGARFDLHLKGSGRTPYSRGGDGKAVLGAVLREFIMSEAMFALGIPTTRALAVVTTGEQVMREAALPGAVLARVASSHIRVGTFQYFYAKQDTDALRALLDHVIARHYPDAADADIPALAVLQSVMQKQADLVAHWMQVGFIHGVMNTDNMTVSGETIDYGPCAFMDEYDPAKVFSSIDQRGRYAFANQPGIAHWNLAQLAQSLLPLIQEEPEKAAELAQEVLDGFRQMFKDAHLKRFATKLGIANAKEGDKNLIDGFLLLLEENQADFTLAFRHLTKGMETGDFSALASLLQTQDAFDVWFADWQTRIAADNPAQVLETAKAANPIFIPRNHRVEAAIEAAYQDDLAPFETLIDLLRNPFTEQAGKSEYETPPKPDEVVQATFCGT
jgi:serine/tyrosine/threonine adenylyltransferase